jgi:sporulation protein YlmC with PRC-barrel domain
MKRSLKKLTGYTIRTKDSKDGKVKDFLFDEKQWVVRYLDADFGNVFSAQRILIPKVFLKSPQWEDKIFPTELGKDMIEKCPKPNEHLPVSRKYENELNKHYQINPYWASPYFGTTANIYPTRPIHTPKKSIKEKYVDTILRSFNEVEGYHIHAIDGNLGHIEDVIIDDVDWQIIYLIIDTKNWLPWSKKVIIAVDWLDSISYVNREVKINMQTETIKNAPEAKSIELIDFEFEKSLYDYYSSSLVK